MASDDPAAEQARVDELKVELRSIVLQLAQGLVQQNSVAPRLLRCEFRDGRVFHSLRAETVLETTVPKVGYLMYDKPTRPHRLGVSAAARIRSQLFGGTE
jgi:hypothetical protein